MNIFVLDLNPKLCAKYHCDKHVIKMILEHAQLLCTAHNLHDDISPYKTTHKNHPCSIWVRESRDNYEWLVEMTHFLNEEYKLRYNSKNNHKSFDVINSLKSPDFLPKIGETTRPMAMPEKYHTDNVVYSYREYYKNDKINIAKWKTEIPYWFNECIYQ